VAFVGLVALIASCSSDSEQVADEISKKVGEAIDVDEPDTTCPDDAEGGEGNTFDCEVEVEGQELIATVTFQDDENFTFEFNGDVFDKDELETQVATEAEATIGAAATFDCGGETLVVLYTDETIECSGEADDGTTGTAVVGLDDSGAPELVDLLQD
jgi:hypothetical protein